MPRGRRNATRDEPHTRLALIWFTETRAAAQLRGRRPDTHPMVSLTKGITSKGIVRPKVLLDQRYRWFLTKSELSTVPSRAARRRFYLRGSRPRPRHPLDPNPCN